MFMQKLLFVASVASQAVLYMLLALSVLSIGIIIERFMVLPHAPHRRRHGLAAQSAQGFARR